MGVESKHTINLYCDGKGHQSGPGSFCPIQERTQTLAWKKARKMGWTLRRARQSPYNLGKGFALCPVCSEKMRT